MSSSTRPFPTDEPPRVGDRLIGMLVTVRSNPTMASLLTELAMFVSIEFPTILVECDYAFEIDSHYRRRISLDG